MELKILQMLAEVQEDIKTVNWMLLCVNHDYKSFTCVYHILDELMVKAVWVLAIINSSSKVVRIRNGVGILPGT